MDLKHVLFVGNAKHPSSTQVRCLDIATRLGCDYLLEDLNVGNLPSRYSAFLCVKPVLGPGVLEALSQRGKVVWDIIDLHPPKKGVEVYLASTEFVRRRFNDLGRVEVIHHHHCNFEGTPNDALLRRPTWLGCRHWLPPLENIDCDIYRDDGLSQETIIQVFRKTGISLNLRHVGDHPHLRRVPAQSHLSATVKDRLAKEVLGFHVTVNSGIKLINSMGFGIPSISSDEPAYRELGPDCTIFSTVEDCSQWVAALQSDDALYNLLRDNCLRRAADFHITMIVKKYEALLKSL